MNVRAMWIPMTWMMMLAGCQSAGTLQLPWSRSEPLVSHSESQQAGLTDELKPNPAVFGATASGPGQGPDQQLPLDSSGDAVGQRADHWIRLGQQAVRQAEQSPQQDVLLTEALQNFREALKADPDNADAFHGLAIVADLSQDWGMAEYNYKRALAARPQDPNLLNDIGYSYLLQHRYQEATQYLNRALQVDPQHGKSQVNLAILDIRRGDDTAALARLSRLYPPAQAEATLAGLVEAQRPALDSQTTPGSVPQRGPSATRSIIAGVGGARPEEFANTRTVPDHQMQQTRYVQSGTPFSHPSHGGRLQSTEQSSTVAYPAAQQSSPSLFDGNGVIQTRPATLTNGADFGPPAMETPVARAILSRSIQSTGAETGGAAPSALEGARPVGGTFTLSAPPQQAMMTPRGAVPSTSGTAVRGPSTAWPGAAPQGMVQPGVWQHGDQTAPATNQFGGGAIPQPWGSPQQGGLGAPHGMDAERPIHIWPEQFHGGAATGPAANGNLSYGTNQFTYSNGVGPQGQAIAPGLAAPGQPDQFGNAGAPGAVGGPSAAVTGYPYAYGPYGATQPQPGYGNGSGASGFGPATSPQAPGASLGYPGGLGAGSPGGMIAAQPGGARFHGVSLPGPESAGNLQAGPSYLQPGGMGPAAGSNSSAASQSSYQQAGSLAPPSVTSAPVMGPGYRAATVTAPDPLEEYRATQRQVESQYNRALQQVSGYSGGSSLQ